MTARASGAGQTIARQRGDAAPAHGITIAILSGSWR